MNIRLLPRFSEENDSGTTAISKEKTTQQKLSFDPDSSIFLVEGHDVLIKKFTDQYHLLRIIFEDEKELYQEWFFSDIAGRFDYSIRYDDKKFYNAAYQINAKVARYAHVEGFFILTRQSLKLSPRYKKRS